MLLEPTTQQKILKRSTLHQLHSESEAGINGSSLFLAGAKNLDGSGDNRRRLYNSIQDPGKICLANLLETITHFLQKDFGWSSGEVGGLGLSDVALDGSMDGGVEPEDLIHGWVKSYVELAINGEDLVVSNGDLAEQRVSGAYVTAEGLDLAQLVQKFLRSRKLCTSYWRLSKCDLEILGLMLKMKKLLLLVTIQT